MKKKRKLQREETERNRWRRYLIENIEREIREAYKGEGMAEKEPQRDRGR